MFFKMIYSKSKIILFILIFVFSKYSAAGSGVSVNKTYIQDGLIWYQGQWFWNSEDDNSVVCINASGCIIFPGAVRYDGNTEQIGCGGYFGNLVGITSSAQNPMYVAVPYGSTVSQAWTLWTKVRGTSGAINSTFTTEKCGTPSLSLSCMSMMIWQTSAKSGWDRSGRPLPGSICGSIPQPNMQCNIVGSVNISHGSISSSDVQGNRASAIAQVVCTSTANVSIKLDRSNISLGLGNLRSTLDIDGKVLNSNGVAVTVPNGIKNITINSTLSSSDTQQSSGEFRGSGVLVVDVM